MIVLVYLVGLLVVTLLGSIAICLVIDLRSWYLAWRATRDRIPRAIVREVAAFRGR